VEQLFVVARHTTFIPELAIKAESVSNEKHRFNQRHRDPRNGPGFPLEMRGTIPRSQFQRSDVDPVRDRLMKKVQPAFRSLAVSTVRNEHQCCHGPSRKRKWNVHQP
jgi:hypothetical protein